MTATSGRHRHDSQRGDAYGPAVAMAVYCRDSSVGRRAGTRSLPPDARGLPPDAGGLPPTIDDKGGGASLVPTPARVKLFGRTGQPGSPGRPAVDELGQLGIAAGARVRAVAGRDLGDPGPRGAERRVDLQVGHVQRPGEVGELLG